MDTTESELERRRLDNEAVVDAFEKDLKDLLSKYPGIIIHCDGQENVRILFCRRPPFVSRVLDFKEYS